jgi:hypothetical protein
MHCLAECPKKLLLMIFFYTIFVQFFFVWGASPGCFKKATQTPNAMLDIPFHGMLLE